MTLAAVLGDLAVVAPPGRFTLAGYSMGGRIALHLALAPAVAGRVARLVLIGASPGIADPRRARRRRAADERLAARSSGWSGGRSRSSRARWATSTPVLAGQPRRGEGGGRTRTGCATRRPGWRGAAGPRDRGAALAVGRASASCAMPVTLIVGERDAKFRQIAAEMAAALPRARVETVPGAGHAVHLEAPERVAACWPGRFGDLGQ